MKYISIAGVSVSFEKKKKGLKFSPSGLNMGFLCIFFACFLKSKIVQKRQITDTPV